MPNSPDGADTSVWYFDSVSITLFDGNTCSIAGNSGSGGATLGNPGSNVYNGMLSRLGSLGTALFDSRGGPEFFRLSMASGPTRISCRTITQLNSV